MELMKKLIREAKDQLVVFDLEKAKPLKAFPDFGFCRCMGRWSLVYLLSLGVCI